MGESIIMPMDMSTEATTRSMIRKGMNSRKPIWKAVLSSEVTKAGTRTVKGTSSGVWYSADLPMRANMAMSASRVWPSMNWRRGALARSAICCREICSSR